MFNIYASILILVAIFMLLPVVVGTPSWGAEAGANSIDGIDCTKIEVEYEYDSTLTGEENLEAMDAAFYASLSKFDYCSSSNSNSSASGAGGDSGSGGGDGASAGNGGLDGELTGTDSGGAALGESVEAVSSAASDMSGTEKPVSDDENVTAMSDDQDIANADVSGNAPADVINNGAIPKDIPSAENDSAFEAQIRKAAMAEADPEIKKRLWNEYRKYKGLPTKGATSEGSVSE